MKRALSLLFSLALAPHIFAVELASEHLECGFSTFAPQPDSPDYRKYAPDRPIDILHLALDVTPNFKRQTVAGKATLTFKPISKPVQDIRLDAVDLTVISITSNERIKGYEVTSDSIVITFDKTIPVGKEMQVMIEYTAQPAEGLYFRTPEMGYRNDETHLWTQGELMDHRHWYPSHDFPNEKFSSEIICRVPEGMTVLSNGKLVSQKKEGKGLVAVHWRQEKPHVNYLITLVAGYFKKLEAKHGELPMAFYVPAADIAEATNTFRTTGDTMTFLEKEIGVPYPWEKYDQVVVRDFVVGGMENTSLTTLTDRTLFTDAFENTRSSEGLVAHELAHQWFGNVVTCKDWSHTWLNEGFATYYALLYDGHKNGRDSMRYALWQTAKTITSNTNDPRPIVYRNFDKPGEQFGYLSYQKGAWILHMLRSQLGADAFQRAVKTYLERHQYDVVVTEDLNSALEQTSGRSLDRFFDQFVYGAHHPELEADYSWGEKSGTAKVSVKQKQKVSEKVALFQFPLKVRFHGRTNFFDREIVIKDKDEDFYFSLPETPHFVVLDPELELLAKIDFKPSKAMLLAQLGDRKNVMSRLVAVEQLGSRKDHDSVARLQQVLNEDEFFGARVEAAKALQSIHNEEALEALLKSSKQKDARVRKQVVASILGFFDDAAGEFARSVLGREKNPEVVAQALRGLGVFDDQQSKATLLRYLDSESYRNFLADAAIAAMRAQGDPEFVPALQQSLKTREQQYATRGFVAGLDALAYLARNVKDRTSVRQFLIEIVRHKKQAIRVGAIGALGTLEDVQSLAVLETFASAQKASPERSAAEKSIAAIRSAQKPVDNLSDLRKELRELKQLHGETRKELETLKKKVQAQSGPSTTKSRR